MEILGGGSIRTNAVVADHEVYVDNGVVAVAVNAALAFPLYEDEISFEIATEVESDDLGISPPTIPCQMDWSVRSESLDSGFFVALAGRADQRLDQVPKSVSLVVTYRDFRCANLSPIEITPDTPTPTDA